MRRSMTHKACSPDCAAALAKRTRLAESKKEALNVRRADAKARQALKPRSKLAAEAQTAINRWIRHRDAHFGCVSCDKPATWPGQWHAGHYRSTGARPDLRFDEANIHRQCSPCNLHLSGNLIGYRATLVLRIGLDKLARLEGPPTADKLTRDELIDLKREYTRRMVGRPKETWIAGQGPIETDEADPWSTSEMSQYEGARR